MIDNWTGQGASYDADMCPALLVCCIAATAVDARVEVFAGTLRHADTDRKVEDTAVGRSEVGAAASDSARHPRKRTKACYKDWQGIAAVLN